MRRALLAALAAAALVVVPIGPSWSAPPSGPGSAGTATSLPPTDSKVTVAGRDRFKDLNITVNQTRDLVNQAISVTWTGGTPTTIGSGARFASDYLQLFQCWGDDDGAVAGNPGPPPEQCQQGASDGLPEGRKDALFPPGSNARTRIIGKRGDPNFDPTQGYLDEQDGILWKPFRPVEGQTVDRQADFRFQPSVGGGNYWLNEYFNVYTTNEIEGGRTAPNGTGAELFEASTGLESSGLGCGKKVQALPDGSKKTPTCWLVVVPRGSAADENAAAGIGADRGVATSPLAPAAWRNRIAIPLEFSPVDSSCPISAEQRRLVGSELFAAAVSSWQPALCATPGTSPYSFGAIGDSSARQQLLSGAPGAPGLGVVSRPFDPATVDPLNPVIYAPLSLSGTVIGFNIERVPKPEGPPEEESLRGSRVADLNLTPRLVAKLLTQSYRSQVEISVSRPDYDWSPKNPAHLRLDPEFLRFNPEFDLLENGGKNLGGLLLPSRNSDVARQVWEWVLSDPEAKAWTDGAPDPWGMKVNPVYATTAAANSNGAAFDNPVPETYPKSDPHCYQAPAFGPQLLVPPPLCGLDWLPYTQSLRDAARLTRVATDGAKTTAEPDAPTVDKYYRADPPQVLGSRAIVSMTDSASAAQYGLQTARLSRSGDNGPDRSFIAADERGLLAAARAMAPKGEPAVLEPNPGAGDGAYPLSALTYAAVAPLGQDALARKEYASLVDYAAGPGQVPGRKFGQLPPGYAPLPADLRAQATKAAAAIRDLKPLTAATDSAPGQLSGSSPSGPGDSVGGLDPGSPPGEGPTPGAPPAGGPAPDAQKPSKPDEGLIKTLLTPIEHLARSRFLLPSLVVVAVLAALGALEITRRPRRAGGLGEPLPAVQTEASSELSELDRDPPGETAPPGKTEELQR